MTTQQQLIANAVANLLKQDPGLAGGRVFVGRRRPIAADKSSAIVVRLERSARQAQLSPRSSWSTLIGIECYGRDGPNDVPGTVADELVEQVFARLDGESSLGGLAMDVEPLAGDTLAWDIDEFDTSMACITARFVVKHQTTGRTLTL